MELGWRGWANRELVRKSDRENLSSPSHLAIYHRNSTENRIRCFYLAVHKTDGLGRRSLWQLGHLPAPTC